MRLSGQKIRLPLILALPNSMSRQMAINSTAHSVCKLSMLYRNQSKCTIEYFDRLSNSTKFVLRIATSKYSKTYEDQIIVLAKLPILKLNHNCFILIL